MPADPVTLQLILADIQQMSDNYWNLLERPRRLMDDRAWVGPSARTFAEELHKENRTLRDQLSRAVELVQRELLLAGGGPWRMVG